MKVSLMRLLNITKVGFMAIARNKMRSALTMLGIIIGVGCVITIVALGAGASSSIQSTINSLGTNFIMIFPGAATQSGARVFTGESKLTPEDVQAIKTEAPAVAYASAGVRAVPLASVSCIIWFIMATWRSSTTRPRSGGLLR